MKLTGEFGLVDSCSQFWFGMSLSNVCNLLLLLHNIANPTSDILIRLSQLPTTRSWPWLVFANPIDRIYKDFILVLVSWISGHFHFKPADYSLTPFAKIESPQMLSHDMDINNKQTTLQSDINIKRKERANMVKFHFLPLQQCRGHLFKSHTQ